MSAGHIKLTKVQKTCLPTLYGKALDARTANPILGDTLADEAVRQMDFDFTTLRLPKAAAVSVPVRAKQLDGWTREFLAAHPRCTVLHLGCGLDTRVYRIDPSAEVRWYDVDMPDVIELREQLYPGRENYEMIDSSITEPSWLDRVSADRPVLVVAEGLVMHVPTADMVALFQRIMARFASGQFIFDVYGQSTARVITWASRFLTTPVRLYWGLPQALANEIADLRLADTVPYLTLPELVARLARNPLTRAYFRAVEAGFTRKSILHMRYQFAGAS